jgi:spoIIIJ-associated protein
VSQRENMVAVTEDDNLGQPPVTGDAGAGTAAEPAAGETGEVRGDATDSVVGDADATGDIDAPGDADATGIGAPGDADVTAGDADATGRTGTPGDADAAADADGVGEADGAPGEEREDGEAPDRPQRDAADLEQESEIAADYVEGLLDVADLDGDIDMDVEGDRALVSVVGATLQELVGPHGEVLEALQELTRLAVHRQTGVRTRIMLDVGGYRARRRTELTALGQDAADDVSRTGVARRLDPMTPFERKIVHDAVAAAGLRSESEGEEPNRRVVVLPAG